MDGVGSDAYFALTSDGGRSHFNGQVSCGGITEAVEAVRREETARRSSSGGGRDWGNKSQIILPTPVLIGLALFMRETEDSLRPAGLDAAEVKRSSDVWNM